MTGKGKGMSIASASIGPAPGFEGLETPTYPVSESLKPSWLKTIEKELSDVKDKNLELCDLVSDEKDKNKELEQENYTLKVRIATLESQIPMSRAEVAAEPEMFSMTPPTQPPTRVWSPPKAKTEEEAKAEEEVKTGEEEEGYDEPMAEVIKRCVKEELTSIEGRLIELINTAKGGAHVSPDGGAHLSPAAAEPGETSVRSGEPERPTLHGVRSGEPERPTLHETGQAIGVGRSGILPGATFHNQPRAAG